MVLLTTTKVALTTHQWHSVHSVQAVYVASDIIPLKQCPTCGCLRFHCTYSYQEKSNMYRSTQSMCTDPHSQCVQFCKANTMQQVQVCTISCIPPVSGSSSESTSKLGSMQMLSSTSTDWLFFHSSPLPSPSLHVDLVSPGLFCQPVNVLVAS